MECFIHDLDEEWAQHHSKTQNTAMNNTQSGDTTDEKKSNSHEYTTLDNVDRLVWLGT